MKKSAFVFKNPVKKDRLSAEQTQQTQQAQQIQPTDQQYQRQELDPKLKSWMSKNPWFGNNGDLVMTRGAQAIHEQFVAE